MPPLEPLEEDQGAPRKHGDPSLCNRDKILRAIGLLRPVAVSFSLRRAHGCSAMETDAAQRTIEDVIGRLRSVSVVLERGRRAGK